MSHTTKTIWRLSGEEVVNCNCAWGCPCQFNALPTTGRCEGLNTWRIDKGHYGDITLDRLAFVMLASWPGPLHEGNGTHQFIIDQKATPEQRQALLEITSGKNGGTYFEIFSAICPTTLDPIFAPITFEVDRKNRNAAVRIPHLVEAKVEPIKNVATGEETRALIHLPHGFEYTEAEMGNTVHFKITTDPKVSMEHRNCYAQLNTFDWSNL
jgi:hypothetical protein